MRIATWNINSITARLPRLLAWLESSGTDVLCVQETKCTAEQFPHAELRELGYEAAVNATGRWNGVAVVSRVGLADVVHGPARRPRLRGRAGAPGDLRDLRPGPRLVGLRAERPRGRPPALRVQAALVRGAADAAVAGDAAGARPFAVLGDYNVAPTDEDVWDTAAFEGVTHVTPAERAALAALREDRACRDVVPRPLKYDHPYTYWDYRELRFPKNSGMRIDLVYGNEPFAKAV